MQNIRAGGRPDILVIHAGGNDLGVIPQRDLVDVMKQDLTNIWRTCPGVVVVWSEMVPRLVWRFARDWAKLDRSRGKINKLLASFVRKSGGVAVRHTTLEERLPGYYGRDGVHLSDVGWDLFNLAIADGVEKALLLSSGGSCHA
ncbi:hypothetical protein XENTR_v10018608 [Xenopus tropicalis]|nr:hypothetical protein XENTR_v10018608 [Xenopus tropicalis]